MIDWEHGGFKVVVTYRREDSSKRQEVQGIYPYAQQARMVLQDLTRREREMRRLRHDDYCVTFSMVGVTFEELHDYRRSLKKAARIPNFTTSEDVVNNTIW